MGTGMGMGMDGAGDWIVGNGKERRGEESKMQCQFRRVSACLCLYVSMGVCVCVDSVAVWAKVSGGLDWRLDREKRGATTWTGAFSATQLLALCCPTPSLLSNRCVCCVALRSLCYFARLLSADLPLNPMFLLDMPRIPP